MALAVIALTSGCVTPPGVSATPDEHFVAVFLQVDPNPVPLPVAVGAPSSSGSTASTGPTPPISVASVIIRGNGYVEGVASTGGGGSTGGGTTGGGTTTGGSGSTANSAAISPNPGPVGPPVMEDNLTVEFDTSIDADLCQAKATEAAAKHLPLRIEGDGRVTYWADGYATPVATAGSSGSTTGTAPQPTPIERSGANVVAMKIISCILGDPLPPCDGPQSMNADGSINCGPTPKPAAQ